MSEQKMAEECAATLGPGLRWLFSTPQSYFPLQRSSKVLIYLSVGSLTQQSGQPLRQTRR